jgi:hypothetical protein
MKTTVCQMVRHINESGESGLIFSDEVEVETSQSFSYMVPFSRERFLWSFANYMLPEFQNLELDFPCSVNGDMVVLTSRFSFPEISFETSGSKVVFSFDSDGFWPTRFWNNRALKDQRYLGRHSIVSSTPSLILHSWASQVRLGHRLRINCFQLRPR